MQLETFIVAILAGVLATYCMLVMALWAPRLGLPRLDFARVMAELTFGETFEGPVPYRAGLAVIYMNGIFFTLLYATVVARYLPGIPLLRGVQWGIILFFVSGAFYVPLFLREGFFLSHAPRYAWLTSAMVHGVWGLVVGWLSPIVE